MFRRGAVPYIVIAVIIYENSDRVFSGDSISRSAMTIVWWAAEAVGSIFYLAWQAAATSKGPPCDGGWLEGLRKTLATSRRRWGKETANGVDLSR